MQEGRVRPWVRFPRIRGGALPVAFAILVQASAPAQQANGPLASMTIDGATGPGPIAANVRTGTNAVFSLLGAAGAPVLIAQSATGLLHPGWLATSGGIVDLPLAPPPAIVVDGSANPAFVIGGGGVLTFVVMVPPAGPPPLGIPLWHKEALQAAILDPASPAGFRLTAATQATVVQGPFVFNLSLGSDGAAAIDVGAHGFSIPFYGNSYTTLWICVNGFITLGAPDTDFTPSVVEFNGLYPRIAGMWADLDQYGPNAIVRCTIDPAPPNGQAPFVLAEWVNVPDFAASNGHTFSIFANAAGVCTIAHALTTSPSLYNTIVGIGPGMGINPQSSKDLSLLLGPGAAGGLHESFFEFFPGPPASGGPPAFDLFGATLHFAPSGAGMLPAATSSYVCY